jgi:hypothetical protein
VYISFGVEKVRMAFVRSPSFGKRVFRSLAMLV